MESGRSSSSSSHGNRREWSVLAWSKTFVASPQGLFEVPGARSSVQGTATRSSPTCNASSCSAGEGCTPQSARDCRANWMLEVISGKLEMYTVAELAEIQLLGTWALKIPIFQIYIWVYKEKCLYVCTFTEGLSLLPYVGPILQTISCVQINKQRMELDEETTKITSWSVEDIASEINTAHGYTDHVNPELHGEE